VVKLTELHKFKLLATLVPNYFVFTDQVPGSFKNDCCFQVVFVQVHLWCHLTPHSEF